MRKVVSACCAALGVAAGLALASPAANAESVATPAGEVHPLIWMHGGWFKTLDECIYVGEVGRGVGRWRAYNCTYEPQRAPDKSEPWDLECDYET